MPRPAGRVLEEGRRPHFLDDVLRLPPALSSLSVALVDQVHVPGYLEPASVTVHWRHRTASGGTVQSRCAQSPVTGFPFQRAANMIPAHDSPLAALAFDASGTKLATASEKVSLPSPGARRRVCSALPRSFTRSRLRTRRRVDPLTEKRQRGPAAGRAVRRAAGEGLRECP